MKVVWQGRLAQAAGKYGEHAPMAAVCCNACRTCATTNIAALGLAAVAGVGAGVARLVGRPSGEAREAQPPLRRSPPPS